MKRRGSSDDEKKIKRQKKNVFLLGFMGCGKSRVGRILAEQLGWPFLDTDMSIEAESGMTIAEIFESKGEACFRQLEKACVSRVSRLNSHVIALGGGAVMDPESLKKVRESGVMIMLSYPPEILASRIARDENRPLMKGYKPEERLARIKSLLEKREPVYRTADLVLHFPKEIECEAVAGLIYMYLKGIL